MFKYQYSKINNVLLHSIVKKKRNVNNGSRDTAISNLEIISLKNQLF